MAVRFKKSVKEIKLLDPQHGFNENHVRFEMKKGTQVKIIKNNIHMLLGLRYLETMTREARLDAPGTLHQVMIRGLEGRKI